MTDSSFQAEYMYSPDNPSNTFSTESPQKEWLEKVKLYGQPIITKIKAFDHRSKVVRIADMEINLTAIWEVLTSPFRWVARLFGGKAHSRRGKRYSEEERKLLMAKRLRFLAIGSLVAIFGGIILFFGLFAWYSKDLPEPGKIVRREGFSTKIEDRNGAILYDLTNGDENRVPVASEEIPEYLKQAVVATEDKDFYKHQGFDFLTIFRIPYNVIFKGRLIGGSTLTQQLVKNVLLTNERTLPRKFKEFVLALQIENKFSKDEILTMYLNEAPYGGTAIGVGSASDLYFGKKVSELNLVESAVLAGLPQRPTAYSPFTGKTDDDGTPLWKVRTLGVLRRMKEDGYLTDLGYEEAVGQLDSLEFEKNDFAIKAPHFVFYVRDQLEDLLGEDVFARGGFTVTTSLDAELQDQAEEIVKEEIEKVKDLNITNGSAMAVDPQTGEILTMVGSVDYFSDEIDGQFNVAVDGLRQPGSSIKPVTYLEMFKKGYNPSSVLMDVETVFAANDSVKPYQPKNYDGKFRGPVTLRNALGSSLNIPAVKSLAIVGIDDFLQQAYDMGFTTLEPTPENKKNFGLAATLGGAEVHLIDQAMAYSAFANGGRRVEPVSILKVVDQDGNTIYEHKPVQGREVMTPEEAFLINNVLSDNNARLLAFGANSLLNTGKPVAVKTGTTNEQKDNWTVGWSQGLLVDVWVGNNDGTAMKQVASGITGASPIWRRILLTGLDKGYPAPQWEVPSGIEQVQLDKISGYPAHDGFEEKTEYVIKGTLPATPDPIHTKLKLCRGENKLAPDARVSIGDYDEKEFIVLKEDDPVSQDGRNRWQEAIDAWVAGQTDEKYHYPTEYCGGDNEVTVRMERPENEKKYDTEDIEFKVEAGANEGIEKIEIFVNGSVKETINDRSYSGKIHLGSGRYEVYAKATARDGKTAETGKVKIGTGGQDWKEPAPQPSPSPSQKASPTPSPSPSPSPTPTPLLDI